MAELPGGTVTFLFTDIEGSTRRWERLPAAMERALARHDEILRVAIADHAGAVFKTVGDGFCAVFADAAAALAASLAAQRHLAAEPWGAMGPLRVRMALHTAEAAPHDGDYHGPPLNRVARILAAAHGGQVLLSRAAAEATAGRLPPGTSLRDLGAHRLKDLDRPERVFQLAAAGLPADFPPLRSLDRRPTNLPTPATPLLGRDGLVAAAVAVLTASDVRLLTLTGPGGIGKTRLALQVAADSHDAFPDGVWFVDLSPARDPDVAVAAIAAAVGVREEGTLPLRESLRTALRDDRALLVLDNFEQVLDAAPVVAELLAGCRAVKALATSRGRLRLAGERELPVPPLDLPSPSLLVDPSPDRLADEPAVRLFVERARAAAPGFRLTRDNAAAVAGICVRLEGLPLAIELAAARAGQLAPPALLARLTERLPLLTRGGRELPARQQTMRAAIAWSHDLLAPPERTLFRRLAVFVGGCATEAAETVAGDLAGPPGGGGAVGLDVLDGLDVLAEQGLVRYRPGPGGEPRVAMFEVVREYAAEQLAAAGEADETRRAHALAYLDLAERAEPALVEADQATWLDRLAADHDNLRAALDTFAVTGQSDRELRLAAALGRFWWVRGHLSEGRARLDAALGRATSAPLALRARALDGAGVLAEAQADGDRAAVLHGEALALRRSLGDAAGCAASLDNLGLVELHLRGNAARAQALHEEALALFAAAGDERGVVVAASNLGNVAIALGRYGEAEERFRQALTVDRRQGDTRGVAIQLTSLGALAFWQGDAAKAAALYEESLPLWRELGDNQGIALALGNLGEAVQHEGDLDRAERLYDEALALSRDLGDRQGTAFAVSHLGQVTALRGDPDRAVALLAEGARLSLEVGELPRLAECLEGVATVLAEGADAERATLLLGAADALREEAAAPVPPVHQPTHAGAVARARAALGEEAFAAAWAAGRGLTAAAAATAAEAALRVPSR